MPDLAGDESEGPDLLRWCARAAATGEGILAWRGAAAVGVPPERRKGRAAPVAGIAVAAGGEMGVRPGDGDPVEIAAGCWGDWGEIGLG